MTSNVIISLGAVASVLLVGRAGPTAVIASLLYLSLNLVFLAQNGLVNPTTNGLRISLFGFVMVSLLLLAWLRRS
ncbi:MAG: hypothetical protein AAFU79_24275 [Myxococcota bacterium]